VSTISWTSTSPLPSLSSDFSSILLAPTNNKTGKLLVSNIYPYYCPPDLTSYELSNYSHHRLRIFANASLTQLNEFYSKVQKSFPILFGRHQLNPSPRESRDRSGGPSPATPAWRRSSASRATPSWPSSPPARCTRSPHHGLHCFCAFSILLQHVLHNDYIAVTLLMYFCSSHQKSYFSQAQERDPR
jgi:hypothetical protein